MNRNAKTLQSKTRSHQVIPSSDSWRVISGTTGETYHVRDHGNDRFSCFCRWSQGGKRECTHILAVRNWLSEIETGRTLELWPSEAAASRSHHKREFSADGLHVTARAPERPTSAGYFDPSRTRCIDNPEAPRDAMTHTYIAASWSTSDRKYWIQRRRKFCGRAPHDDDERVGGVDKVAARTPAELAAILRRRERPEEIYVYDARLATWLFVR